MLPVVAPSSADVVANANSSADSSQKKATLDNDPLLINKPWSEVLALPPELFFAKMIKGSSMLNVVDSMVVVEPFTVRLPSMVTLPDASTVVNLPAAAAVAPMVVPSMDPPLMSTLDMTTEPVPLGVIVISALVTNPVTVWLAMFKLFNSMLPVSLI